MKKRKNTTVVRPVQPRLFDNKKLAALLIPLALDQLLNSFMGTVDTLVVSNLGSAAISAVSLVDSINVLVVQAFFALASGGTVICSHYLGCKKENHAREAARQLVFITFILSLIIAGACLVLNRPILKLIFGDVEAAVMKNARIYFFFSAVSYPFIALYDDGSSILRAQENSRLPMLISVWANVLNLVLNLVFVWVFHWGVAGSASATMLARIFSMAVVTYKLRNPGLEIPLRNYFSIRPDWKEIKRILHIGIPSGVENSMFQFGKLAIQSTVSYGNCRNRRPGHDQYHRKSQRNPGNGRRRRAYDCGWRILRRRPQGRGGLLHQKALYYFRNHCGSFLPCNVCSGPPNHPFRRHGACQCKNVYLHGNLDHDCKATCMGNGLYSCLRTPRCRRRKIQYDRFCAFHVAVPCYSGNDTGPRIPHGTYGCMDRYVYRLDHSLCDLYHPV